MARIHLIEGPVGSGKSTLASQLSKQFNAPRLILDKWMVTLFSPDRPSESFINWYVERKDRCINQIWDVAQGIIATNSDVILELGLIQHSLREAFYDRVDAKSYNMKIYVVDASQAVRKERVQQRNLMKGETFSMEVSAQIFDVANEMWESIDEAECRHYEVKFMSTDIIINV